MTQPDHSPEEFTARLAVTDGGEPIDLIENEEGGEVWRGEEQVGIGHDLLNAWNDYLYACYPQAPVNDADLKAMWSSYDESKP